MGVDRSASQAGSKTGVNAFLLSMQRYINYKGIALYRVQAGYNRHLFWRSCLLYNREDAEGGHNPGGITVKHEGVYGI
jgi:hypothetical protein